MHPRTGNRHASRGGVGGIPHGWRAPFLSTDVSGEFRSTLMQNRQRTAVGGSDRLHARRDPFCLGRLFLHWRKLYPCKEIGIFLLANSRRNSDHLLTQIGIVVVDDQIKPQSARQ